LSAGFASGMTLNAPTHKRDWRQDSPLEFNKSENRDREPQFCSLEAHIRCKVVGQWALSISMSAHAEYRC
jgi:hypothetical protein